MSVWRRLEGDEYKSRFCVACTGDRDRSGVWAHWERVDGLTLCGEFHKPEDFPSTVTVDDVKAKYRSARSRAADRSDGSVAFLLTR